MKIAYKLFFVLMLSALFSFQEVSKQSIINQENIIITSSPSINPVFKRLDINPQLCIKIIVPSGIGSIAIKKIACTINKPGLKALQKIDLFSCNSATFATTNTLGSFQPTNSSFEIPVDINLSQGTHYLWVGVTLNNKASINDLIEIHCTDLIGLNNTKYTVLESTTSYAKRIGIAIRKANDDSVNTYRIPGLVTTNKGTLLAVYDIRYNNGRDLPGNINVGLSRSTDGGKSWQPMQVIMDMGIPHENNGIGDPTILFDPLTHKIFVAALWSKGNRSIAGSKPGMSADTTGQFVLVNSSDDGLTWSKPYSITPQIKNPAWHLFFQGPGNGISMQDGKLVFPAQYWDEFKIPYSTIIYSDDHGETWKGNIIGPKSNTTESQVVETLPGTLMLNMRDNRGGFRSVATTVDMGKNWKTHTTSFNTLADPVCMASIIKAKVKIGGKLTEVLFFSNPNTNAGRFNITIKASLDLGETWLPINELLLDDRKCYGYSSLTKVDDHTIGILYEGNKDLYFLKIPVTDIIK